MHVRGGVGLAVVTTVLAGALGCGGGASAPEPDAGQLTPVPDLPVPDKPPSPAGDFVGVGRGQMPEPVAVAIETLYPEGRWIRCAVPAEVDLGAGPLSAIRLGPELTWLLGPTVTDGWFAAAAPAPDGKAIVRRSDHTVAQVVWHDAGRSGWTECTVRDIKHYQILGVVQDPEGNPIGGATVRGCEPGEPVVANALGRFTAEGVAFAPCPLLAIVDGPDGLGKSEEQAVVSDGADAIVEITVPAERLAADGWDEAAKNLHGVIERAYRNGIGADLDNLRATRDRVHLPAAADRVVSGWITDLEHRHAASQEALAHLQQGGKDGLVGFWLVDY
ncbi:MAG: hypothetical protein H6733_09585 [Alphaproteobacteria bacterium]|nr:hypothetical protein [Alphaproteobacteria bacterium]